MPTRLVALGDSTVEGLMDEGPGGTYVGWADRYAERLATREPGLLYANLAVRGQTSREVRATQLDRALALRPDVALLAAGVNDLNPLALVYLNRLSDLLFILARAANAAAGRPETLWKPGSSS